MCGWTCSLGERTGSRWTLRLPQEGGGLLLGVGVELSPPVWATNETMARSQSCHQRIGTDYKIRPTNSLF